MRFRATLALAVILASPVHAQLIEVRQTIFGMD